MLTMRIAICSMMLTLCAASTAQTMTSSSISYIHLYSDANGVSHFKEGKLPFRPLGSTPSLSISALSGANGAAFLSLKRGAVEDWHKAPRRQFVVAVKGLCEVEASDGQVRRLPPGTVLLMDDTTGKGHITRSVGAEDHVALMIPVSTTD